MVKIHAYSISQITRNSAPNKMRQNEIQTLENGQPYFIFAQFDIEFSTITNSIYLRLV